MRFALGAFALLVLAYGGYEVVRVEHLASISKGLVAEAVPYERSDGKVSLLVLGDSTAVGVGAEDPAQTVAGRLGAYLDASVENHAKSGAVAADLPEQLAEAAQSHYDFALVQIGANDVIQFHSIGQTASELQSFADTLQSRATTVIYLTAGKIGDAPLFPLVMRPILNARAGALRARFMGIARDHGALYVDLYTAPLTGFDTDPSRYYAPDDLHLTGDGYGLWYGELIREASLKWPQVFHAS